MKYSELFEGATPSFYDTSAVWLHGGPSVLKGGALTRFGKNGGDYGALFFCKDETVGRWYVASYAGTNGRVWSAKLSAPVDTVCDITNVKHRAILRANLDPQEFEGYMSTRGSSGHLDWASIDTDRLEEIGFRGCVFQERPAGMETNLPASTGMAKLPYPVISVGIFSASDVHITGSIESPYTSTEKLEKFIGLPLK